MGKEAFGPEKVLQTPSAVEIAVTEDMLGWGCVCGEAHVQTPDGCPDVCRHSLGNTNLDVYVVIPVSIAVDPWDAFPTHPNLLVGLRAWGDLEREVTWHPPAQRVQCKLHRTSHSLERSSPPATAELSGHRGLEKAQETDNQVEVTPTKGQW